MAGEAAGSVEYQERVVAFVDVLGFAEIVSKSNSDFNARALVKNVVKANRLFEHFFKNVFKAAESTFFSDSFVFSMQSPDLNAIYVIREVGFLCRYLMLHGLICRGAIVSGLLYHDGRFVIGPALVSAYRMERIIAIYPRVLLDAATLEHWTKDTSPGTAMEHEAHLVKRDSDGEYFLDLFSATWASSFLPWTDFLKEFEPLPSDHKEFLGSARRHIEHGLLEHRNNRKVLQKYEWLSTQLRNQTAV